MKVKWIQSVNKKIGIKGGELFVETMEGVNDE